MTFVFTPLMLNTLRTLLCIMVAGGLACGDSKPKQDGDGGPDSEELEVSQPDTEDALATLIRVTLQDLRAQQDERAIKTIESWVLPEPETFFSRHFSADAAQHLLEDYTKQAEHIAEIADVLKKQLDKGRDQVSVQRIASPEDPRSVGLQRLAIFAMTTRVPLYSVRLTSTGSDDGYHLWSFVHDGRAFRWLGKLRPIMRKTQDLDRLELRLEQRRELSSP